jgi:hypothetical protein
MCKTGCVMRDEEDSRITLHFEEVVTCLNSLN